MDNCYAYGMHLNGQIRLAVPIVPDRSENYRNGLEVNSILKQSHIIEFPIIGANSDAEHRFEEHYHNYNFNIRSRIEEIGEERNFFTNNQSLDENTRLPIYSSIRVTVFSPHQAERTTYLYLGHSGHKTRKSTTSTLSDYSLRHLTSEYTSKTN